MKYMDALFIIVNFIFSVALVFTAEIFGGIS
jgi:hypothetical protein